jgi:hypothetical protein
VARRDVNVRHEYQDGNLYIAEVNNGAQFAAWGQPTLVTIPLRAAS